MDSNEAKEAMRAIDAKQDTMEEYLQSVRNKRMELQLSNIEKGREFIQKIGELSFIVGAAIIPVIIASKTQDMPNLGFIFAGVGLYLLNGLLSLWLAKSIFERNANDVPFVGLDEEIHAYPIINTINKLMSDFHNEEYRKEWVKVNLDFIKWTQKVEYSQDKQKIDIRLDVLIATFVFASLLVAKSIWTFGDGAYWITFLTTLLLVVVFIIFGYRKAKKNYAQLSLKQKELAKIRQDFLNWQGKHIFGQK